MSSVRKILLSFLERYCLVILLLIVGGAIFMALENVGIESSNNKQARKNATKNELQKKWSEKLNVTINSTAFEQLYQDMVNFKEARNTWSLSTGTHFAFTIMSTIGYGVIVPTTDATKIVCMLYAVISIPIFLYALAAAGEIQKLLLEKFLQIIEKKIMKRDEVRRKNEKVILCTIILFFIEIMLFSAIIYWIYKKWRFIDCVYYWFITASTIGFGDYVLSFEGNNKTSTGILFVTLIVNLIMQSGLATILNAITEMITERAENRGWKNNCCIFKRRAASHKISEDQNVDLRSVHESKD